MTKDFAIVTVTNSSRQGYRRITCKESSVEEARDTCLAKIDELLQGRFWGLGDYVIVFEGDSASGRSEKVFEGALGAFLGG